MNEKPLKANIMLRRKECRKFKWVGLATACATWLYDWKRYVERGDGDVVVVDAKNAAEAKKLARDILDGRLRPTIVMGWEGVKTRLFVHGLLSAKCLIGADVAIKTWDAALAKHGKVPISHTDPMIMYDKLMAAIEERCRQMAPKVYIEGTEVIN